MGDFADSVNQEIRRRRRLGHCSSCGYPNVETPNGISCGNECGGEASIAAKKNKLSKVEEAKAAIRATAEADPNVTLHEGHEDCPLNLCTPGKYNGKTVVHIDGRTDEQKDPNHRSYVETPLTRTHVF